jgi:predicted TIM-barrel fold metal-dependent hydrolase
MLYAGPRIDSDVHHRWRDDAELIAYLPKQWRDLVESPGRRSLSLLPPALFNPAPNGFTQRVDSIPPTGGPPGSDLATLQAQLLDPFRIEAAVLSFDVGLNPGLANVELASAVTTAMNEWSIERWLSGQDRRLYGSLLVNTQLPEIGGEEIRRFGRHPRIVEALMVVNGAQKPMGHPVYDPVFKACVDAGLPLAIHIGGDTAIQNLATATTAGGTPSTRFERHATQMQPVQHYLTSFLVHGVFEKFPSLRLIIKETGVAWLPWLFWELDACEQEMRLETSWIRKRPTDYLREHLWVTSQPLDEPPNPGQLTGLLDACGGIEDMICFSTDYPHHDTDDPDHIARRLPDSWWDRVFYQNATRAYGWPESIVRAGRAIDD